MRSSVARTLIFALFAILVVSLTVPMAGVAEESSGKVVSLKNGKLFRWDEGKWSPVAPGGGVRRGDKVKTDEKAMAILEFSGAGRFVIGPATELRIAERGAFAADLPSGRIWVDASSLNKGGSMRVATPVSVAGVRGTKFAVISDSMGAANCTCEGLVDVTIGRIAETAAATIPSPARTFVEVGADGAHPGEAQPDLHLLRRKRGDRYDWCFTCHEVGGKGKLKKNWSEL